jgi:hypothetical protein
LGVVAVVIRAVIVEGVWVFFGGFVVGEHGGGPWLERKLG